MHLKILLIIALTVSFFSSEGQVLYSISGIVKEAEGVTLPSATIFLDGSEKKTSTNDKGEYSIGGLEPGTYVLTVHFVGYKTSKQNVIIQDKSLTVNVNMEALETSLKEVVIRSKAGRNKYLPLFLKSFLGDTENGRACIITNPGIIRFSEETLYMTAKTRDFLEIENRNLGYKIKYLLREFRLNRANMIASFTGECIFESLSGSPDEMEEWKRNRRLAYDGSLMHYFRSLYSNTANKEGFFFYFIKEANKQTQRIDTYSLNEGSIAKHIDSNFVEIQFSEPLYVVYDASNGSVAESVSNEQRITKAINDGKGSIMAMHLKKAVIDAKGSIVDYRSFLVRGYWGERRIGDQLPFEYLPN